MDQEAIDRMEREAARAILAWAEHREIFADDGEPLVWGDGRPIAIDVLNAIIVLRRANEGPSRP